MNNIAASKITEFKRVIAFYISDYGYGHATRSIALLRYMMSQPEFHCNRIIICTGDVISFVKNSIGDNPNISYRNTSLDIGYTTNRGSVELSESGMHQAYLSYMESFSTLIQQEKDFLMFSEVGLVISDISPIPFVAADKLGIASIGISNFSWFTAYQDTLEPQILQQLKMAYSKMDHFISLPGADEPSWGRKGSLATGFYCRSVVEEEITILKRKLGLAQYQKVVFFTMGLSIHELDDVPRLPIWNDLNTAFIVSSNVTVQGSNIYAIPKTYLESQHYLAVSDFVITKPGWSTISEAVLFKKKLLLIQRSGMREDENSIQYLEGKHPIQTMCWQDFKDINTINFFSPEGQYKQIDIHSMNKKSEKSLDVITRYIAEVMYSS